MDRIKLGERIEIIRKQHGLSQKELAAMTGMAPSYYSNVVNGKYNISVEKLISIAEHLHVSYEFLLNEELYRDPVRAQLSNEIQTIIDTLDNHEMQTILELLKVYIANKN